MILLGGFASFALAIAAVGLFGVLSYSVAQRSCEIAVRSALGASPARIVALVVRQGLVIAGAGIAAGIAAAVMLARSMATFLYGITPYDAVKILAVPWCCSPSPRWRASPRRAAPRAWIRYGC